MTKWEYKFLVMDLPTESNPGSIERKEEDDPLDMNENELNVLGQEGWEVVAVIPKMGAGQSWTYALLKRPKEPRATVKGHQAKM